MGALEGMWSEALGALDSVDRGEREAVYERHRRISADMAACLQKECANAAQTATAAAVAAADRSA